MEIQKMRVHFFRWQWSDISPLKKLQTENKRAILWKKKKKKELKAKFSDFRFSIYNKKNKMHGTVI